LPLRSPDWTRRGSISGIFESWTRNGKTSPDWVSTLTRTGVDSYTRFPRKRSSHVFFYTQKMDAFLDNGCARQHPIVTMERMANLRKMRYLNLTPARICVLAGVSSIALTALLFSVAAGTVQADVRVPNRVAFLPAPGPAAEATPASLAPPIPARELRGHRLRGVASWYGRVFNGRKTASGERFDMYAMTACSPTLPFGSKVRVVNLMNRRSVVVRINDRGDLVDDRRIIDVSYAAAEKLAMVENGLAPVSVQVLSLGQKNTPKRQ
jgi:rare lipoprotein A